MTARRTLAERMSALGDETGGFTANPWTSRHFGFDAGFDHFEDFIEVDTADGEARRWGSSPLLTHLSKVLDWWKGQDMFMTWESLYDDILSWVEGANEPYFLWIFLVDVHVPYIPPAACRTESLFSTYRSNLRLYVGGNPEPGTRTYEKLLQCYDDTVGYVDSFVERLLGELAANDPLLFFHSDHGGSSLSTATSATETCTKGPSTSRCWWSTGQRVG